MLRLAHVDNFLSFQLCSATISEIVSLIWIFRSSKLSGWCLKNLFLYPIGSHKCLNLVISYWNGIAIWDVKMQLEFKLSDDARTTMFKNHANSKTIKFCAPGIETKWVLNVLEGFPSNGSYFHHRRYSSLSQ